MFGYFNSNWGTTINFTRYIEQIHIIYRQQDKTVLYIQDLNNKFKVSLQTRRQEKDTFFQPWYSFVTAWLPEIRNIFFDWKFKISFWREYFFTLTCSFDITTPWIPTFAKLLSEFYQFCFLRSLRWFRKH